jgi:UDPglucose--hexose-1-phosphate uridylyltransferase
MAILVQAYQLRYRALENIPSIRYISIFKNHGTGAGTSLLHPHSQIIASPVVPENVLRRVQRAEQHYRETSKCLYCHIVDEELRSGSRVVYQDEHFLVFHPFASARPAETWIVPFRHQSSIGQVNKKGLNLFSAVLSRTLKQLSNGFGDPDFNYAIHSVAGSNEEKPYLHWYLQLVPRLTMSAGFELGSGIQINSKSPESTAAIMRQAIV